MRCLFTKTESLIRVVLIERWSLASVVIYHEFH